MSGPATSFADALTCASFNPLTQKKTWTRVVDAQIAAGANGRFRFAFGAQIETAGSSIGADGRHQSEVTGPRRSTERRECRHVIPIHPGKGIFRPGLSNGRP
jgi:hypothetical protein